MHYLKFEKINKLTVIQAGLAVTKCQDSKIAQTSKYLRNGRHPDNKAESCDLGTKMMQKKFDTNKFQSCIKKDLAYW